MYKYIIVVLMAMVLVPSMSIASDTEQDDPQEFILIEPESNEEDCSEEIVVASGRQSCLYRCGNSYNSCVSRCRGSNAGLCSHSCSMRYSSCSRGCR